MLYPEATVGAVIYNAENKILLCKSHKWENKYVIPGGHIELGEKMEQALKREIIEETGLEIFDIKLIGINESIYSPNFHKKRHFLFIDFLCKTLSSNVRLNDEAQEYKWVDIKEIEKYELGGFTKSLLEKIRNWNISNEKIEIFYNY